MNIFEKKLQESAEPELPIDPIELYQTCAYKDGYGYLRGIQEEVLKNWHQSRSQRDIICKMNTGSGKTLTGLLNALFQTC
ncbi:MAG: DEAD/DEAH box helicase family protein [Cytophagales bacterium]|nr:DEAD/DEAH box helicase family protein [Cytophagales bacterium]